MKRNIRTAQAGYAMLLMVLALMGIGGVVLTGFTQGVKVQSEDERYLHNQRVLREAKQALLQYAYNYPVTAGNGPGRLPCPDIDRNGNPDPVPGCDGDDGVVGRLPWKAEALNFYKARDAAGEELWYAVSNRFGNSGTVKINSDTTGTIIIRDRSGAVIHDASAGSGAVAVIIAPGAPIRRSDALVQDRGADENLPANYLDVFNGVDNANFSNLVGDDNGFVTGPIYDVVTGDLFVNDQMIVITAAEVIAMAEKATLQAYRETIDDYLNQTGGVYPWLYNYKDIATRTELNDKYPADLDFIGTEEPDYLGNHGRIPSIFANYFELNDKDSVPLRTELTGTITIDFGALGLVSRSGGGGLEFNPGVKTLSLPIPGIILDDVKFEAPGGSTGRLSVTLPAAQTVTHKIFLWDEDATGMDATGYWTLCPHDSDALGDCWRDGARNPTPEALGGDNDNKEEIMRIDFQIDLPATLTFDADYTTPPSKVVNAASPVSHATIVGTIAGSDLDFTAATTPTLTPAYELTHHYHDGNLEPFVAEESGELTLDDLLGGMTLTLEIRYYPELPYWAYKDGWHNSVMMAYAFDYRPDQNAAAGDCGANPPCLQINGLAGANNDKISIIALAGEHAWVDGDINPAVAADGSLENEVGDVFNLENLNQDNIFDIRTVEATAAPGDAQLDKILVIK